MKRLIPILVIVLLTGLVSAQQTQLDKGPGMIQPDSALYGLEVAVDNAGMSLGVMKPGDVAQERAAEAANMAEENKSSEASKAAEQLGKVAQKSSGNDTGINKALRSMNQTIAKMQKRIQKAPNQQAKQGMQTALQNMKGAMQNMKAAKNRTQGPTATPGGGPPSGVPNETDDDGDGNGSNEQGGPPDNSGLENRTVIR